MANKKFQVPVNLVNLASDPETASEGDIYYNTANDVVRVYANGAWTNVGAGGGSASDSFKTISVSGQSNVVADSSTDTLTFIAGTNVSIETNATNDSITINSAGTYTSVDSITYPDYITFDTTPETIPTATGSLFWDSGDGLPSTVLNSNVTIGLGQEQVALVKNDTGSSIAKGKVVYINGAIGQRPTITLSDADTEATSSKTFGLTAETIADEAEGFVVTFGVLRGVNTLGLTEGAPLWLSTTAGGYTTTVPPEPAHSVFLGYVVKAHETAGEIFINIQNGYELNELHGVTVSSELEDQVLRYDAVSGLWGNTQENIITAINGEDATIPAGTPVYFSSYLSSTPMIGISNASTIGEMPAHGITVTSSNADEKVKVITSGILSGVDLSAYDDGVLLYVAAAGGLTSVRPTGDNVIQPIAKVISASSDIMYVFSNDHASYISTMPNLATDKIWFGVSGRPVETTLTSDIVDEGSNNLYFTNERAQDAFNSLISGGSHNGISIEYNDSSNLINFSNTGVTSIYGTGNEISVSGNTGSITIGIPDSPVFVTPNIGVATATSINGTTIPSSKTLVVTTDIGSTVQGYDADLAAIAALTGTSGLLSTNGSGTWSVDTNTYSTTSHNHTVDSLSNVIITGTPSDGQALVWDTTTSKWINETVVQDLSAYLTTSTAASTYQPLDSDLTAIAALSSDGFLKKTSGTWAMDTSTYLTSYTETDTLETVTDRGATSTNAISITNTTPSTSTSTGALIVSGGLGVGDSVWIEGDLHVAGTTITENTKTVATHDNMIYLNAAYDSTITNAVGDGTYVTYTAENMYTPGMDIRVTGMNPSGYNISSADGLTVFSATSTQFVVAKTTTGTFVSGGTAHAKEEANPDLGFAGGYYSGGYAHAGLFRDASDGIFKIFDGYTPEPDEAVNIDTTHASFSFAPIKVESLDVVDGSTTRTNLGLAIGTDVQAYNSTLAAVAGGTYAGDDSITTLGTVTTGTWNGTTIGYAYGGTGLTTLGTAGQVLKVNSGATALEWGTVSGGGGGGASITISSSPPSSPTTDQLWQDLDTGRIYVWNGTHWIEVQQNGSLGLLRYLGAASSAPTTSIDGSSLQVGEVYFDTTFNVMKVYDGTGWEDAFTAGSLSVSRWVKVMSGGQTSLSGNDDNSVALSYTAGIEEVYLNGVKLIRTSDYIATDGTTITNLEPIAAGSVVEVISYSGFTVANTYTKTEVDNMLAKQGVRWTEVAGAGTSITTLSGTDDYSNTLEYTPGNELVYINGILIARGIDYTATDGTSIVLATALVPGDIVEVIGNTAFSVANTYTKAEVDVKLNTLTSPTINGNTSSAGNINPSVTNTYDLGTTSLRWRNIYTQDLHLSNGIGDYTVVEGEEDLFLVNNKSGKSFKFALIEVDPSQVPPKSESN